MQCPRKKMARLSARWSAMIGSLENTQARQLTELYRALRLYVNCYQPSMKLQSKLQEGKKVRCVYDPAKTPLQRLLPSGVLPGQQATGTHRSCPSARPSSFVSTTRAVAKSRLSLCCQLCTFCSKPTARASQRVFRRRLYSGSATGFGELPQPDSRVPHPVPRTGEEKTCPGLATYEDKTHLKVSGNKSCSGWLPTLSASLGDIFRELKHRSPGRYQPFQIRTHEPRHEENTNLSAGNI
jgi:hypothetical protein